MTDLKSNDRFSEIIKKSKLEMPYSDFEDNVMYRIQKEIKIKEAISKNIKFSILFFVLGTVFGLFIGDSLSQSLSTLFSISKEKALLIFQIGYIMLFLTQLDNIISLLSRHRIFQ